MRRRIAHRNRSPHGWWVASYIERAEWRDESPASSNSRCLAWENIVLLKARNRDEAYDKAISLAQQNKSRFKDASGKRKGRWIFEGLTSLLPIYDELRDGAEITWLEHKNRTVRTIRSLVKRKRELEVFDDTPAIGDSNS